MRFILWNPKSGQANKVLSSGKPLADFCFSPDGELLVGAGGSGIIHTWRRKRSGKQESYGSESFIDALPCPPTALALTKDGRFLVLSYSDGQVQVRKRSHGFSKVLQSFKAHDCAILGIDISPDSTHLATRGWQDGIKTWNLKTVRYDPENNSRVVASADHEISIPLAHDEAGLQVVESMTSKLAFAPDGKLLVHWGVGGKTFLIKVSTGQIIQELLGHDGPIYEVNFSPDGKLLASCGRDGTIKIWRAIEAEKDQG